MEFKWIPSLNLWAGIYEVANGEYRQYNPLHSSGRYKGHTLDGDRQPATKIAYPEATSFAAWLTDQEREAGGLPVDYVYRLPTEEEWLALAACSRSSKFPWGDEWPPAQGNFADEAARAVFPHWFVIESYDDSFPVTAPVEQSGSNEWGLHGLAGNVWEITTEDASGHFKSWKGGGWQDYEAAKMLLAFRYRQHGWSRDICGGARLVLAPR